MNQIKFLHPEVLQLFESSTLKIQCQDIRGFILEVAATGTDIFHCIFEAPKRDEKELIISLPCASIYHNLIKIASSFDRNTIQLRLRSLDGTTIHHEIQCLVPYKIDEYEIWCDTREKYLQANAINPHLIGNNLRYTISVSVYKTPIVYFEKFLHSVLNQTFKDFNLFILDHGNDLNTNIYDYLRLLENKDDRITVFRLNDNRGIMGANLYLLEQIKTPYFIPVDADDVLRIDALEIIDKNNEDKIDALFSDEVFINEQDVLGDTLIRENPETINAYSSCLWSHIACYRTNTAKSLKFYSDETCKGSHDWDSQMRLLGSNANIKQINETLYGWRMHSLSTAQNTNAKNYITSSQLSVVTQSLSRRNISHLDPYQVYTSPGYIGYKVDKEKGKDLKKICLVYDLSCVQDFSSLEEYVLKISNWCKTLRPWKCSFYIYGATVQKSIIRKICSHHLIQRYNIRYISNLIDLKFDERGSIFIGCLISHIEEISDQAIINLTIPYYLHCPSKLITFSLAWNEIFSDHPSSDHNYSETKPLNYADAIGGYFAFRDQRETVNKTNFYTLKVPTPYNKIVDMSLPILFSCNDIDIFLKALEFTHHLLLNSYNLPTKLNTELLEVTHCAVGNSHISLKRHAYKVIESSILLAHTSHSFKHNLDIQLRTSMPFINYRFYFNYLESENYSINENSIQENLVKFESQYSPPDNNTISIVRKRYLLNLTIPPFPTKYSIEKDSTIHIILPSIDASSFTGGPNTAYSLLALLTQRGFHVNVVSLNPFSGTDVESKSKIVDHCTMLISSWINPAKVSIHFPTDINPLIFGINDIFIATMHWTMNSVAEPAKHTKLKKPFYLIQDYEPLLYPFNDDYICALNTYSLEHYGIINSSFLTKYMVDEKIGNYDHFKYEKDYISFDPSISIDKFYESDEKKDSGKFILLVYYRPDTGARNLASTCIQCLQYLIEEYDINFSNWEFWGMGDKFSRIDLGKNCVLNCLPWMNYDDYCKQMRKSHVLLSLMLSPHPSYPPLEFAQCGGYVVTNKFSNKNEESFAKLSPKIICSELNISSIAKNLYTAIKLAEDESLSHRSSKHTTRIKSYPDTWALSLEPVVTFLTSKLQQSN